MVDAGGIESSPQGIREELARLGEHVSEAEHRPQVVVGMEVDGLQKVAVRQFCNLNQHIIKRTMWYLLCFRHFTLKTRKFGNILINVLYD